MGIIFEGEYTVRAENVFGAVTSTAYFKMTDQCDEFTPEFAIPLPTVANLMDGDEVTLCCQVTTTEAFIMLIFLSISFQIFPF